MQCNIFSFDFLFFLFLFLLFYGYKFRVFAFLTHRKIIAKLCEPNFSLAIVVVVVVVVFIVAVASAAAIWHALRVPNNICNYLFQFASIVAASKPASQSPTTAAKIVELCAMNNTKCLSISSPPPPVALLTCVLAPRSKRAKNFYVLKIFAYSLLLFFLL